MTATVLVIEDNPMNLELIVQLLEDDYTVITANDGQEGVDRVRADQPDLVVMDLSLPVLDGWEATRLLKADAGTAAIPVVALTAHAMPGDEEEARAAGCDEVLTKPIDEDELFAVLDRYLGEGP